jgi:putative ABC transport system substrate-binding protein
MRRRQFIAALGSAAAWPLAARAQQSMMPAIGFLNPSAAGAFPDRLRAFRQGLKDAGFAEGEDVAIVYRWAENQTDRLPELVSELVRRKVTVITAFVSAALAAKAATATIPIVFLTAENPVKLGLVVSLARPAGNATGINILSFTIRMTANAESSLKDLKTAAHTLGMQIQDLNASTNHEIDAAFATFVQERPDALFVASDPFFTSRRVQLANLAARHMIPMISGTRKIADVGGLMSYGPNIVDAWRQKAPWSQSRPCRWQQR